MTDWLADLLPLFYWLLCQSIVCSSRSAVSLTALCGVRAGGVSEVYVWDYLLLRDDVVGGRRWSANQTLMQQFQTGAYCQITIDSMVPDVAGFIVNVHNNLPVRRRQCGDWSDLFRIRSEATNKYVDYGCTRFATQYFPKPIRLSFLPVPLARLSAAYLTTETSSERTAFAVTVTSTVANCSRAPSGWSVCPGQMHRCIRTSLLCDGVNHCGLSEDETACTNGSLSSSYGVLDVTKKAQNGPVPTAATKTESKEVPATAAPATSSEGLAMILGFFAIMFICIAFFIFLGLCSFGCCTTLCYYKSRRSRPQGDLAEFFSKYGTICEAEAAVNAGAGAAARQLQMYSKQSTASMAPGVGGGGVSAAGGGGGRSWQGAGELIEPESEDHSPFLANMFKSQLQRSIAQSAAIVAASEGVTVQRGGAILPPPLFFPMMPFASPMSPGGVGGGSSGGGGEQSPSGRTATNSSSPFNRQSIRQANEQRQKKTSVNKRSVPT